MLIGHQKIWQFLIESAKKEKLSHAYLFFGPEKIGKKTFAWQLIKWLFGDENIQKRPHPDLIIIEPEKKEIKISQIRDLILKLTLKPSLAPFKVGIIDQAHLMNKEAQNCLLKTLENPKGKTILILITEFPNFLFPTILSRIQQIKFHSVRKTEIESYLRNQKISEEQIQEISKLAMGRPGIAIDFISDSKKLEERKEEIKELFKILNSDLAFRFQYVKEISEKNNLNETLNIWLSFFRSLLLEKCLNQKTISKSYSLDKLKKILWQIQNTIFLISTTNINSRLALEILMLEL